MTNISKIDRFSFDIPTHERPLLTAAKKLGKWVLLRLDCSDEQKIAVKKALTYLDNLPQKFDPLFNMSFGFQILPNKTIDSAKIERGWLVAFIHGEIEIGSWFSSPDMDVFEEVEHQFEWFLKQDGIYTSESNRQSWIDQVTNPEKLVKPGYRLILDVDFWSTAK